MTDFIFIEQLKVDAFIGVYDREKVTSQCLVIDVFLGLPSSATTDDCIENTVDYAKIVMRIRKEFHMRLFNLIETAAENLAQMLLKEFRITWVKVHLAKLAVLPDVGRVGVEIMRECKIRV